jgi:hypothetical protein
MPPFLFKEIPKKFKNIITFNNFARPLWIFGSLRNFVLIFWKIMLAKPNSLCYNISGASRLCVKSGQNSRHHQKNDQKTVGKSNEGGQINGFIPQANCA